MSNDDMPLTAEDVAYTVVIDLFELEQAVQKDHFETLAERFGYYLGREADGVYRLAGY